MNFNIDFCRSWPSIRSIDMHTGGEPLRIITDGLPEIHGKSIIEKISYFKKNYDHLRTRLVWEPRGHADMYAAILTEPVNKGSDFGVFFLHNEGYSSMCGHAILALTTLAARSFPPEKYNNVKEFHIDVPSGIVRSKAIFEGGKLEKVSFYNVPSYVDSMNLSVKLDDIGEIQFDIAFGGAFYAYVDADKYGIDLIPAQAAEIISLGRRVKVEVMKKYTIIHPVEEALSFLYGVIFYANSPNQGFESRNVCIFADGELDRSATGTGVSGKAALLHAKGLLEEQENVKIESLIGSHMQVGIHNTLDFHGKKAIIPEVSGEAYITGEHTFVFDENDPLVNGFFLR